MTPARAFRILAVVLFVGGSAIFLVETIMPEWLVSFGELAPILTNYCLAATFFAAILYGIASAVDIAQSSKRMFLDGTLPETKLVVKPLPSEDGKERFQLSMNDGKSEAQLLKHNKRWGTNTIIADQKTMMIVLWVICILFNLMALPSIVPVTKAMFERREWGLAFVYLFPILGIALFAFTVRTTLQHRRFGKSFLDLRQPIAYIGENFSATIRSSVTFVPTGDYLVRFRCQQQYSSGTGKRRRTVTKYLFDRNKRYDSKTYNALSGIPFEIEIPGESTESYDPDTRGTVQWYLSVKAPMEGVDYEAEFEVPVFFRRPAVGITS